MPALEAFIDSLITEKFADSPLDEATRAGIRRELTDRLNQYLTLRTIEAVSAARPEAVKELADLIKTNPDPHAVQQFISRYISEPDLLVGQIFADFKRLYIGEGQQTNIH